MRVPLLPSSVFRHPRLVGPDPRRPASSSPTTRLRPDYYFSIRPRPKKPLHPCSVAAVPTLFLSPVYVHSSHPYARSIYNFISFTFICASRNLIQFRHSGLSTSTTTRSVFRHMPFVAPSRAAVPPIPAVPPVASFAQPSPVTHRRTVTTLSSRLLVFPGHRPSPCNPCSTSIVCSQSLLRLLSPVPSAAFAPLSPVSRRGRVRSVGRDVAPPRGPKEGWDTRTTCNSSCTFITCHNRARSRPWNPGPGRLPCPRDTKRGEDNAQAQLPLALRGRLGN